MNKWGIRFQPPPVSPCRRRLPLQQKYHHSTLRLSQSPCRPGRGFRYRIYRCPWITRSLGAPTGQGKSSYPAHLYSLVKVHERLPLTILLGHFFRKTKADSQNFTEIFAFCNVRILNCEEIFRKYPSLFYFDTQNKKRKRDPKILLKIFSGHKNNRPKPDGVSL